MQNVDITMNLDNVTINANTDHAIYKSSSTGSLTLNITNTVTLNGANGSNGFALNDTSNAALVISGTGELYANGGNNPSGTGGTGIAAGNGGLAVAADCTVHAKGGNGRYGGNGINMGASGSITNEGTITATGGDGSRGGDGGRGISAGQTSGTITNKLGGTIIATGGDGGDSDRGKGGNGGNGVYAGGSITNSADAANFRATGGKGGTGTTNGADGAAANQSGANITVGAKPSITTQPSAQSAAVGQNATFSVAASGTPAPTYQWQESTDSGGTWGDITDGGVYSSATTNALTLTGVTIGMNNYQYRCVATNAASSVTSNAVTLTVNPIAPGAPTLDSATPGNAQITLAWTAPSDDGGSTITDYEYSTDGTNWKSMSTTSASKTITETSASGNNVLVNGTTYACSVRAVNTAGESTASSSINATPMAGTAAMPTASPSGGTYAAAQTVTLSCATVGATIYYTTDGTDPTTSGTAYSSAITVPMGTTLKAYATATGYIDSAVMTEVYTQQQSGGGSYIPPTPASSFASGGTYAQGGGQSLVHTTNKDFSLFSGVRMDGKTITRDTDYKAENGSTVVTVFAEYLDTLSVGKHKLSVLFKDGVTVMAEFEILEAPEPEPWVNPFDDVDEDDWFYGDVEYVYEKGLMGGTNIAPMLFSPYTPLTRGMVVTILWRKEGSPVVGRDSPDNPFSDVPSGGAYYADAVHWAVAEGIVTGYDGKFMPQTDVTRQDLAVIFWRYAQYAGMDVSAGEDTNILSYGDAFDVAEYAIPAMQWSCGTGIISGKPGGLLDPRGPATRAEAAAMLHRK